MLASARYELRLAALPPDALIAIAAGAMRDSPAANRRAEALLAHHSPPPAVATDGRAHLRRIADAGDGSRGTVRGSKARATV